MIPNFVEHFVDCIAKVSGNEYITSSVEFQSLFSFRDIIQSLDEAEHDIKNYSDREAEADNKNEV